MENTYQALSQINSFTLIEKLHRVEQSMNTIDLVDHATAELLQALQHALLNENPTLLTRRILKDRKPRSGSNSATYSMTVNDALQAHYSKFSPTFAQTPCYSRQTQA